MLIKRYLKVIKLKLKYELRGLNALYNRILHIHAF